MRLTRREFIGAAILSACGPETTENCGDSMTMIGIAISPCSVVMSSGGGSGATQLGIEGQPHLFTPNGSPIGPVSWYVDDVLAGTATDSPYTFEWTATPGEHTIKAVDAGASEQSLRVSISAQKPVITSPNPGLYVTGTELTFTATAFDDAETSEVRFLLDGSTEIASDAGTSPWSGAGTPSAGTYELTAQRITGGSPVTGPGQDLIVAADPGSAPALPSNDFAIYAHTGVTVVEVSSTERRVSAVTPTAGTDILAPSATARPWLLHNVLSGRPVIRFRGPQELARAAAGVNLGDGGCWAVAFRMRYTNGGLQTIIRSGSAARQAFSTTGSGLASGVGGAWSDGNWRLTNFSSVNGAAADQSWHIAMAQFFGDTTPDVLRIDGTTVISSDLTTGAGTGIQFGDDSVGVIGVHFELAAAVVASSAAWSASDRAAVAAHLRHAANYPDLPAWVEP